MANVMNLSAIGPSTWTETGSGSADSVHSLAHAAAASTAHYVAGFSVVVRGAAVEASDKYVRLYDGPTTGTLKWEEFFAASAARGSRIAVTFDKPIELTAGNAATLSVEDLGASAIATSNMHGFSVSPS